MITEETLAKWEKLCEAATPGPWKHYFEDGRATSYVCQGDAEIVHAYDGPHDAAFIAAARTALPEAIGEIRRLQKQWDMTVRLLHQNGIHSLTGTL